jgi:hypothetical protein
MKHIIKISAGIVIILGGTALSISAATQLKALDPVIRIWVLWLVFGNALAFIGAGLIFCPLNYKKCKT